MPIKLSRYNNQIRAQISPTSQLPPSNPHADQLQFPDQPSPHHPFFSQGGTMHNQSHANTPQPTNSCSSPVLTGEVSRSDGGGLSSPSPTPELTESLLEDLLDPAMTPILICQIHGLTLPQLNTIIHSTDYRNAIEAIQSINAARQSVIESQTHLQSLAALKSAADLAHQLADQAANSFPSPRGTGVPPVSSNPQSKLSSPGLHFGGPGEVAAQRTEGVFLPLPRGEGRGEGSSSPNLSHQLKLIESLRKATTTLLRETRPTPPRRPRRPSLKKTAGCHGLPSSQAVSSPPNNQPSPPTPQLWHAVCDTSPAGIWCSRRNTDAPTEARHELRHSNLSIRSTHLHPPTRRDVRKSRKPWYRRV